MCSILYSLWKLKFANKDQSIATMIKDQIIWDDVTVDLIDEYLKSGTERVLLVLDGLDEIDLKLFPQVSSVLTGKTY